MARAAVLGRLTWQLGEVVELVQETARVTSLVLELPGWPGHRAGQHIDVRLTADDGYQAQRSYSIASPPEERRVTLTVERLEDGEVSPYLVGEVMVGDRLELRGPIGGYFVWEASQAPRPILLIGGGSGVVPLTAMLRHRRAAGSTTPARLLYSVRSIDEVIYRAELEGMAAAAGGPDLRLTLTRAQPPGWRGYARRIDREMVAEVAWPAADRPLAYVCGPTSFVETAAEILVGLGYEGAAVLTERFGPTGG
jgi:ferredoxin-NADP reductase